MFNEVLMARQSILNNDSSVYGYELLYRGVSFNAMDLEESSHATNHLISNLFSFFETEWWNDTSKIFINVNSRFIRSLSLTPCPSKNLVLEILEDVRPTKEITNKIKQLKRAGYVFALDDYGFEEFRTPFLPLVSYIKVDILASPEGLTSEKVNWLKKSNTLLLAEKIEDQVTFEKCKNLGYDYFQGYFLEKPKEVRGASLSPSRQVSLSLLEAISNEKTSIDDLVQLIECDPTLSLKILLLVNSALYSFKRHIDTIKEAIIAIGIDALRKWTVIILLVTNSNAPIELFRIVLTRAKTLESYANLHGFNPGHYFMVGLLSGIEAIFATKLDNVLKYCPVNTEIKCALSERSGDMGKALQDLLMFETGQQSSSLHQHELSQLYWNAAKWTDDVMKSVSKIR